MEGGLTVEETERKRHGTIQLGTIVHSRFASLLAVNGARGKFPRNPTQRLNTAPTGIQKK